MAIPGLVPGMAVAPSRPMKSVRMTREAEGDAVSMKSVKVTSEGASTEEDVVSMGGLSDWIGDLSKRKGGYTISSKGAAGDNQSCCEITEEHGVCYVLV